MKRVYSVLLAMCLLLSCMVTAFAADDEAFDHVVAGGVAVITNYAGADADIVVPQTLSGCPVTAISADVFAGNTRIRSVTLPDGVTELTDEQFAWCTSLERVTFGKNVRRIGVSAFAGCSAITEMTVPDSVTSIGAGAVQDCNALTTLMIGSGVTKLPGDLCNMCTALRTVFIGQNVTSVGRGAFSGCFWTSGDLYLGEKITSLPDYALDVDFHGTIHCFEDSAIYSDLPERELSVQPYAAIALQVLQDAPLSVMRADTPQAVPQEGLHVYAVYSDTFALQRELTDEYTIPQTMMFDKVGAVQIPVRYGTLTAAYSVTVLAADPKITAGGAPIDGNLRKKIALFASYRNNPVQLGIDGIDADAIQSIAWRVTEGGFQVSDTGKVTHTGLFAATGVVQVTVTDINGVVHTDVVRIIFYRLNLQMMFKFAKYR